MGRVVQLEYGETSGSTGVWAFYQWQVVPGLGWMVLCLQEFDGENGGVFPGVSVTSQMKGKGMSFSSMV